MEDAQELWMVAELQLQIKMSVFTEERVQGQGDTPK